MYGPRIVLSVALLFSIIGGLHCGGPSSDSTETAHGAEVAWFDGDSDAAFALAKNENRPLFLYWGAEWCPPCHALKTRIFHAPEFVDKIHAFVPVYLDGDTDRAQILGEELGVLGYPTVIIFSPSGEEIMRMPSDVSVEQYVALLDTALTKMRPMREVLDRVLEVGAAQAEPGELNLLSFYSWGQDNTVDLDAEAKLETFGTLYRETPASLPVERSRFLTLYLDEVSRSARRSDHGVVGGGVALSSDERTALRADVLELLHDENLRAANLQFVIYSAQETIALLHPESSAERDALTAEWEAVTRGMEDDESLTVDDRLSAVAARIDLARLRDPDAEIPAELIEHVRERVAWAGEAVSDEGELQAVMSTMVSLLDDAGLADEAEALLQSRMDDTHAPYYYMGWMASMKSDGDRPEEALRWYRKAYDSSRGRYSRFRWGSIYLRRLMELTPDDVETVRGDSLEILAELLTFEDAFAGGNFMRLNQLDKAYAEWNSGGAHDDVISEFRERVHGACGRYPGGDEDSQMERCSSFLEGSGEVSS